MTLDAGVDAAAAALNGAAAPTPPRQRRRLWQLDPAAHELLLALSFAPSELRALAARALGRLHGARCVLGGSDADVLFSLVPELARRSALSEALHDALQRRHAAEGPRWQRLRGAAALQQAVQDTLAAAGTSPPPAAALWALLTHPDGAAVEAAACGAWRQRALQGGRDAGRERERAAQAEAARRELAAQVDALQLRLQAQQREHDALRQRLAEAEAALRGARRAADAPVPTAPAAAAAAAADDRQPAARSAPREALASAPQAPPAPAAPAPAPVRPAPAVAGRRVLCVGGMPGARQRYRALLEAAGAHFEYHDGGLEDSVARLDRQLAAADLVVCHSGCLNHAAVQRIKGHCRRAAKPCLYLERPSLSTFARELGLSRQPGCGSTTALT